MPNSEKNEKKVNKWQQKEMEKNVNNNKIVEIDEEVDVSGHSPEFESTNVTLIGLSQYYNPDMDINMVNSPGNRVPMLSVKPKPIIAAATKMDQTSTTMSNTIGPHTAATTTSIAPKLSTYIASIMDALTKTPATIGNWDKVSVSNGMNENEITYYFPIMIYISYRYNMKGIAIWIWYSIN